MSPSDEELMNALDTLAHAQGRYQQTRYLIRQRHPDGNIPEEKEKILLKNKQDLIHAFKAAVNLVVIKRPE